MLNWVIALVNNSFISISRGLVTFLTSLAIVTSLLLRVYCHYDTVTADPPLHSTSDLMSTPDTLHRTGHCHVMFMTTVPWIRDADMSCASITVP